MTPEWSLKLVAAWCEDRAKQSDDRKLLKRLHARFSRANITAYERFANAVEQEVDERTEFWMRMAKDLREEAEA